MVAVSTAAGSGDGEAKRHRKAKLFQCCFCKENSKVGFGIFAKMTD